MNYMLKNVAQLVHTRHRSVHNFLINLLAAMGRTASSSPSQQSTSTTRCRTQTVDSPFGNSSNPIFTEAHQAATFIVVRHYPHTNQAFSVHTYPELALLGRPFRIGIFSRRREEVEGGKGTEGERRDAGGIVAVNQGKRGGCGGGTESG